MTWLIDAETGAAWKSYVGEYSPAMILWLAAGNAFRAQFSDRLLDIIAHKIEFGGCISVGFGRMDPNFSRRKLEDQPAFTCIDAFEAQNIA
jgi:hypothetical protein